MKNRNLTSENLSLEARMFIYILLQMLKQGELNESSAAFIKYNMNVDRILDKLSGHLVIRFDVADDESGVLVSITPEGLCMSRRYLEAVADELKNGHFGKMRWLKNSAFHRRILEIIDYDEWKAINFRLHIQELGLCYG